MARRNGPIPQKRKRTWMGVERDKKQRKNISLIAARKQKERSE